VVRNVSLQANAKVTEEVIDEQSKLIKELQLSLEQKNNSDVQLIDELRKQIESLRDEKSTLNNTINELNAFKRQYEDVKNQVNHVETFRNELIKSRKETETVRSEMNKTIDELNSKIDYLQLTPAKRKKIDSLNKPEETSNIIEVFSEPNQTEDGGSF
jgi:chromosome segregation ATPase